MIIYGVLAEESIGRLYLAGFIPGFLLAGIFMFIIAVAAKIWPSVAPREAPPSWRVRFLGLLSLLPVIALMFIVLGTIYLGDRHAHGSRGLRGRREPSSSPPWTARSARAC